MRYIIGNGDALIMVDVQQNFCPGGSLPIPHGEEDVPPSNGRHLILVTEAYLHLLKLHGTRLYLMLDL
jgi:nicotinamidase-related amidase